MKKIIPCLDVKDGRVVKGINFVNFRDAGDPAEAAVFYESEGADELVFLDIAATVENRATMVDVVRRTAAGIGIPFTVGGGIRSIEDIDRIMDAGATKVSLNSAALKNPELVQQAAEKYGSNIVVAIDVKQRPGHQSEYEYDVYVSGGQVNARKDPLTWAIEAERLGAGSILLTSMDFDGTKDGYDIKITRAISGAVDIPVIASGGAGKIEDFYVALTEGGADGALAASLFHFRELSIGEVKRYLSERGVKVRL